MEKKEEKANSSKKEPAKEKKEPEKKEPEKPPTPEEAAALFLADLKKSLQFLEKSVNTKDPRLTFRVLRNISNVRRKATVTILTNLINSSLVHDDDQSTKQELLDYLSKVPKNSEDVIPMEITPTVTPTSTATSDAQIAPSTTTTAAATTTTTTTSAPSTEVKKIPRAVIPEVEIYLRLLVTIFLIDKKKYEEAVTSSNAMIQRLHSFNRRSLNPLSAKAYFYFSRAYELTKRLEEIRGNLLGYYRTATLRRNDEAQATLLNLLLRNYLEYNLYDQADKLVSKVTFKEESTSSNQYARYLYYQGQIKSVQLDYTEAYRCLLGAIRKAPQNSAKGFRQAVHKLACIVQLLMGEIPERSIFRQPGLKSALSPYLQLTQTVRIGDLAEFHNVVNKYGNSFRVDKTYTLIQRLRHNVIKTGLRKINVAYSKISFDDICSKLSLDSPEDAEFIVAKAIRDGVINATIDHEGKFIQSKENIDIYSTQEPQSAYHRRITFCLNTHNEAIKAMRFPPDANKPSFETAKERREREQEIAKNLADEDEEY